MATEKKKITVDLTELDPKSKVVRFKTDEDGAAMSSAYVDKAAVRKLGGCENGVRVTIEAL